MTRKHFPIAVAFLFLVLAAPWSRGQILLPDTNEPFAPLIAGCDCVVPKDGMVSFTWRTDERTQYVQSGSGNKLYLWAPPGDHWIEVSVLTQTFEELQVRIIDPAAPDDRTKDKIEKKKFITSFDLQRYEKKFKVNGAVPTPGPAPTPGPTPVPGPTPTGFAGEATKWLRNTPGATKSKAKSIANNFLTIGSQGNDPARNGGWTTNTFAEKTKILNRETLTADEMNNWMTNFFAPLAIYQAGLVPPGSASLDKVAQLWTDTGNAINEAANSLP